MSTPFSRIEMNRQNEGHMDRLREKHYDFVGAGGGGGGLRGSGGYDRNMRSCAHKVATHYKH